MGGTIAMLLEEGDEASPHVERATNLAARRDATLHAVYVIDAWRFGEYSVYGWEELTREIHEEKSEEMLAAVRERCEERGVDFQASVEEGKPLETILDFARANDVDRLVCPRPRGEGRRINAPKTLQQLYEESPVPLEVV